MEGGFCEGFEGWDGDRVWWWWHFWLLVFASFFFFFFFLMYIDKFFFGDGGSVGLLIGCCGHVVVLYVR